MFKNVCEISGPKEKKFFIEQIGMFVKLLSAFAVRNDLNVSIDDCSLEAHTYHRLSELEIIKDNSESDVRELSKVLKKTLYVEFISAINFSVKYKKKIGGLLDKLDPSKRKDIQEKYKRKKRPEIVDFFCGAGGLSLGFTQAGYQVNLATDHEDVCIQTFKYNHPELPEEKVVMGDIRDMVDNLESYVSSEIDVVIGGPPCQGFSSANQQRIIDDPRNELYKYFIDAVEKISPKFVIMENVRGMLSAADQVVEDFRRINGRKGNCNYSYNVDYKVLVSDNFSVAQRRHRLFFIAIRDDVSKHKKVNPTELFNIIEKSQSKSKKYVLSDALAFIKPLNSPRIKNMTEVDDELTGKKVDVNEYIGNENEYLELINRNRRIDFIFNHKARYANDVNYEIYSTLREGEDGTSDRIKHVMPYQHRNHIFKDKYFKLIGDKPSRTITAHLKMDCHSHIHPNQARSITPREAARVQSFPDDYVFLGPYLKTYMQIGNAVPPMMSNGIAKEIKKYL